jgi:hypothetical protein
MRIDAALAMLPTTLPSRSYSQSLFRSVPTHATGEVLVNTHEYQVRPADSALLFARMARQHGAVLRMYSVPISDPAISQQRRVIRRRARGCNPLAAQQGMEDDCTTRCRMFAVCLMGLECVRCDWGPPAKRLPTSSLTRYPKRTSAEAGSPNLSQRFAGKYACGASSPCCARIEMVKAEQWYPTVKGNWGQGWPVTTWRRSPGSPWCNITEPQNDFSTSLPCCSQVRPVRSVPVLSSTVAAIQEVPVAAATITKGRSAPRITSL